jgi:hypothetical protein
VILTGGEIYFLNEIDLRSQKETGFVKIGLVREKESRDTASRLKEHQTGNPRLLEIAKVVKTPLVERVETVLHGKFATRRVSGEWFNFSGASVQEAIDEAKSIARSAHSNFGFFEESEALKSKKSTQAVLAPSAEINKLHQEYLRLNFQLKVCKDAVKLIQEALYKASENRVNVSHLLEVQNKKGQQRFSEKEFATKYPKLYSKFTESVKEINQRFVWSGTKDDSLKILTLNPELADLVKKASSLEMSASKQESAAEKLHFLYLSLLTYQTPLEWKKEIVESKVKSECGVASGFKDVCKWTRTQEDGLKLDKDALKEAHPKQYQACVIESKGSTAKVLRKDRGFRA